MATRGHGPSLLLLLAVAFGVFGMHTLGHPSDEGRHPTAMAAAHSMAATMAQAGPQLDAGNDHGMPPMNPMLMCLAILCAATVLLLALVRLRRLRATSSPLARPLGLLVDAIRGPPRAGVGLLIANWSVLRI